MKLTPDDHQIVIEKVIYPVHLSCVIAINLT